VQRATVTPTYLNQKVRPNGKGEEREGEWTSARSVTTSVEKLRRTGVYGGGRKDCKGGGPVAHEQHELGGEGFYRTTQGDSPGSPLKYEKGAPSMVFRTVVWLIRPGGLE